VITGVGGAIVVLLALLVGLLLVGWWVAGRPGLDRLGAAREPDLRPAVMAAHALTSAEADQVQRAVTWGRELTDPRLRAAAVDWAQRVEGRNRRRRERRPEVEGWLVSAFVVAGAGVIGYAVLAVTQGRWGDIDWFTAAQWLLFGAVGWRRRQGPARAITLNSEPPPASA
jgi:hypothetical protein